MTRVEEAQTTRPTAVFGVGNPWRGDDGAGIEVALRLAASAPAGVRVAPHESGDLSGLLDQWDEHDAVVVVDAASSGATAGSIHRFDAAAAPLPARACRSSSHAFGVAEVVELARVLDRLPRTLEVYAIEGASFASGAGLTREVDGAVGRLVHELGRR
jgi:hydrogenase maturation protease